LIFTLRRNFHLAKLTTLCRALVRSSTSLYKNPHFQTYGPPAFTTCHRQFRPAHTGTSDTCPKTAGWLGKEKLCYALLIFSIFFISFIIKLLITLFFRFLQLVNIYFYIIILFFFLIIIYFFFIVIFCTISYFYLIKFC
jgi:hypothetical protein